eukprot:TRINITY_DN10579_c0_g1_i1.p1 TRINITY_DN10579_c0_g1~~TRINITY_DN10579_c0_g1_i1.p1  ORF type:complete len:285 (+),score=51.15 TRINITY_DN10579_c0_g1_i1:25-855(+)
MPPVTDAPRVVVITGASSGLGAALAKVYAQRRWHLVLAARNERQLSRVAATCRQCGSQVEVVPTDVTKQRDCVQLARTAEKAFGRIDLLVLNAGIGAHHLFEETASEDLTVFQRLMDVNFLGYVYCTHASLPLLRKSPSPQILVISSLSGEIGLPMRTAYCASKFAVNGFFESLRCETKRTMPNLRITVASPPTLPTSLRENSVLPPPTQELAPAKISVDDAALVIIKGCDARKDNVLFPLSSRLAVALKPFAPRLVQFIANRKSGFDETFKKSKL